MVWIPPAIGKQWALSGLFSLGMTTYTEKGKNLNLSELNSPSPKIDIISHSSRADWFGKIDK